MTLASAVVTIPSLFLLDKVVSGELAVVVESEVLAQSQELLVALHVESDHED